MAFCRSIPILAELLKWRKGFAGSNCGRHWRHSSSTFQKNTLGTNYVTKLLNQASIAEHLSRTCSNGFFLRRFLSQHFRGRNTSCNEAWLHLLSPHFQQQALELPVFWCPNKTHQEKARIPKLMADLKTSYLVWMPFPFARHHQCCGRRQSMLVAWRLK